MTQPTIEEIKALNGMDFAMLTEKQLEIWNYYLNHNRKYGVLLERISEAPTEELERAKSSFQYDEVVRRYPLRITVSMY